MTPRLNPNGQALLEQFGEQRPSLILLADHVYDKLTKALSEQGIALNTIEHRVKTIDSLAGKLQRKGDKYGQLSDVTDLVGLRVITYYTDDVDKVAVVVRKIFDMDWQNYVDKRKLHQLNSFGYSSLHYVCRLRRPFSNEEKELLGPLAGMPFEIQIRTALQHVWSAIEHDIGYKGAVKLPPEYRRQFSRLAGMLELADDEFSRLRTTMSEYRRQVQALVKSGQLDEVLLSTDSYRNYLETKPFERLNYRIAAVNQAEVVPGSLMHFLPVLEHFGFETLGDVQDFVDENTDDAFQLAVAQLGITDLDILSESIGLQNLCLVYALKQGPNEELIRFIYDTIYGKNSNNDTLVDMLKELIPMLPFMQNR